ncbi:MAG: hypothetical protein KDK99_01450 [Verrucomicrobiales bacterium]|nr:hypothetical protein [Verrucomicrobiales bacterium]
MPEALSLIDAEPFDARKGYRRWALPATIAHLPGYPQAIADLWSDRSGRLFARFSSAGYIYHYEIPSNTGTQFSEDQKDDIEEFLQEKLVLWMIEGIDDSVLNM